MYAVILTGGKQYSVKVGDSIFVEKLNAEADSEVTFEKVLAVGEEALLRLALPLLKALPLSARSSRTARARSSTSSPIVPRRAAWFARAIVSPTPRWKSPRSTAKEVKHNGT